MIPGNDAILLGSFGHSGALAVGDSYTQEVKVRIPQQIASGTYYITAWADAYDAVFEDSLAINVNPDDPTTLDSSNFKARAIDVIGTPDPPLPDLQVVEVTTNATDGQPRVRGHGRSPSRWTVKNFGEGVAIGIGESWVDSVYLHTTPGITDPGAKVWFLGTFERVRSLDSARELHPDEDVRSLARDARASTSRSSPTRTPIPPLVIESNETNNARTVRRPVVDDARRTWSSPRSARRR